MKGDLHVHTTFSDGKNTPEEMVLAAIEKGMDYIGFSDHAPVPHKDGDAWCMKAENLPLYRTEILALKEKYKDQITIYLGLEMDGESPIPEEPFDYFIGSVHYIVKDGVAFTVDDKRAVVEHMRDTLFGGDIYGLIEAYYENLSHVVENTRADIIGHFDLVTIHQEEGESPLFDETHPRYVTAWQKAADRLLETGKLFEVNTGAISRGYRTTPYPAPAIREYILKNGGKFVQSSDSHRKDTLCFGYE